ncbi:MAG TPA: SRPBCC family protein, partial [Anaerolineales bacterium]|nr:SRPBCC family protein [Anaerolineales bacterium]
GERKKVCRALTPGKREEKVVDQKILEFIDIEAPRDEVFPLLLDLERRTQLSPLWGVITIEPHDPLFPEPGSRYRVQLLRGEKKTYETVITAFEPGRKLAYRSEVENGTQVTWHVQDSGLGTRITYEEHFEVADSEHGQEIAAGGVELVQKWLRNIKNYAELRGSRLKRFIRWFLDNHFLKLNRAQRQTMLTLLFMQFVGMISFVMAAIAVGVANWLT